MGTMENTLLIRHLPACLMDTDKEDLLHHFGAIRVRVMSTRGPMRHCAFATFYDKGSAERALKRLHQLKVEECTLIVEFCKKSQQKYLPSFLDGGKSMKEKPKPKPITKETDEASVKKDKVLHQLPSEDEVFGKWSIQYPRNPILRYSYPPPTVSILTNIANALASFPKFYVQVLHLMNKMNLPAPFGPVTTTPPIPVKGRVSIPEEPDIMEAEEMELSSTEESEIEDEGEGQKFVSEQPTVKRATRKKTKRPSKRARLTQQLEIPVIPNIPSLRPSEVFEQTEQSIQSKKIQFNITKSGPPEVETTPAVSQLQIAPKDLLSLVDAKSKSEMESTPEIETLSETGILESVSESGGFGKLQPIDKPKVAEKEMETTVNYKVIPEKFVTRDELHRGLISEEEKRNISIFKNYQPGDSTSRLYVKNLARQTTEQDLVNIFGRYVDWSSQIESNMFDIRLMREGRMKGQSFISLPSENIAVRAVKETNGFLLHSKPMAVQFARSAKAKETSENKPK